MRPEVSAHEGIAPIHEGSAPIYDVKPGGIGTCTLNCASGAFRPGAHARPSRKEPAAPPLLPSGVSRDVRFHRSPFQGAALLSQRPPFLGFAPSANAQLRVGLQQ